MAPLLRRVVAVVGLVVMTSLATLLVSGKMKVRIERNTLAAQLDAASTPAAPLPNTPSASLATPRAKAYVHIGPHKTRAAPLPTSTCRADEVMGCGTPLFLWDKQHNLTMYGTPKGGATVTAQIMFRLMGLYEQALAYHPWIHEYRMKVHDRGTAHEVRPTTRAQVQQCAQCTETGRCLKLIRNPLDRAVSSFLHAHKTKLTDSMPSVPTFAQWVSVLKTASVGAQGRGQEAADAGAPGRSHWRPQFVAACDSSTTRRVVTHLPVEMLGDGLEAFCQYARYCWPP